MTAQYIQYTHSLLFSTLHYAYRVYEMRQLPHAQHVHANAVVYAHTLHDSIFTCIAIWGVVWVKTQLENGIYPDEYCIQLDI